MAAPSAGDKETARSLLQDADHKYDAKDYRAALQGYEGAHAIMGYPTTGLAVAKTRAALGLLVEARDMALEVTRMPAKSSEAPAFSKARASAEKLAQELQQRIPSLSIDIVGGPGASGETQVVLDGESLPVESLGSPRKTNPGKHVVSASAKGFTPTSSDVDVQEGETRAVTLTLVEDANGLATAPPVKPNDGAVDAQSGAEATTHRHLSPLVYIGFGVGAAGLATGAVTGIIHLSKTSAVKDDYCNGGDACRAGFEGPRDSAKTFATIANIAFGVGIVGVAVGVVALVTSKPQPDATSETATRPFIRPEIGLGSLSVRGAF
jgi:hypothetical protein